MRASLFAIAVSALLLAACGGGDQAGPGRSDGTDGEAALPTPQRSDGSVTGMPDAPGPGGVPITGAPPPPPPEMLPGEAFGLPPLEDNPETGLFAGEDGTLPAAGSGSGVEDAVAVVREYYAAINARSYGRAYALWSDGGRASGQSPQQFADAFDATAGIAVQIGEPGRIEAAAGSRYVEVPVSLAATGEDGELRRYRGAYVLRQAVVDGADDGQRAWRIASADLREVQP